MASAAAPAQAANDRRRFAALAACSLILVALLAFLHVPYPFDDDQGLFTWGARAIAHGARIYVDFWDLKQPGIYWYYALAGSLFGFDEVGIHVFDLFWMLALAGVVLGIARRAFASPLLAAATPLLCLGPFYAKAEPLDLAQVEIIVVLPIALVALLLQDAAPGAPRCAWRYAAAGVLAVVVAAFKLVLAPIPLALVCVALLHAGLAGRRPWRAILRDGAFPAALGATAALGVLAAFLWQRGILREALWVAFVYPPQALAQYPRQGIVVLAQSFGWFFSAERFLLPFALLGFWREVAMRRSRLGWFALAWLVVGTAAVLAQVLSWWSYHFDLFFVPTGLLAAAGVQDLAERAAGRAYGRWIPAAACAVLLVLSVAVSAWHKWDRYWLAGASPFADPKAFMIRVEPRMAAIYQARDLLARPDARPGVIANLGDPRIFLYTGRPAILAVNGSGYMLRAQWRAAAALLARERPAYIYLGNDTRYIWTHAGGAIERLIAAHYTLRLRDVHKGEWYELRDAPQVTIEE